VKDASDPELRIRLRKKTEEQEEVEVRFASSAVAADSRDGIVLSESSTRHPENIRHLRCSPEKRPVVAVVARIDEGAAAAVAADLPVMVSG